MEENLNIQDFVARLAAKHGMSRKNAESFVKDFFVLIQNTLDKDESAKIEGLGSFKLNGENDIGFNIDFGTDSKSTTIPAPSPEDIIIAPESLPEEETENIPEESAPEENIKEPEVTEAFAVEESVKEPEMEGTVVSIAATPAIMTEEVKGVVQTPIAETKKTARQNTEESSKALNAILLVTVAIIAVCVITIGLLYLPSFRKSPASMKPADENAVEQVENTDSAIIPADTTKTENVAAPKVEVTQPVDVVEKKVEKTETPKPAATQNQPKTQKLSDGKSYTISGTLDTHVVKQGESLNKISSHYYGNKNLWSYIVQYNKDVIKNPNNVPFGTKIKIPRLVEKK